MSIWTKPIFGKPRDLTPASPVAARCAAIRTATDLRAFPATMLGFLLGKALPFWLLMIGAATAGASPPPFLDSMQAIFKGMGFKPWLFFLGVILFLWKGLPFLALQFSRWKADTTTREHLLRLRKTRRNGTRILWAFAAVMTVLMAATAFRGLSTFCISAASFAAAAGGALVGYGLTARGGRIVVCAKCRYPMGSWRAAGEQCPECGNRWKQPYRAQCGTRRKRVFVLIGVGLLMLSGALHLVLHASH